MQSCPKDFHAMIPYENLYGTGSGYDPHLYGSCLYY